MSDFCEARMLHYAAIEDITEVFTFKVTPVKRYTIGSKQRSARKPSYVVTLISGSHGADLLVHPDGLITEFDGDERDAVQASIAQWFVDENDGEHIAQWFDESLRV